MRRHRCAADRSSAARSPHRALAHLQPQRRAIADDDPPVPIAATSPPVGPRCGPGVGRTSHTSFDAVGAARDAGRERRSRSVADRAAGRGWTAARRNDPLRRLCAASRAPDTVASGGCPSPPSSRRARDRALLLCRFGRGLERLVRRKTPASAGRGRRGQLLETSGSKSVDRESAPRSPRSKPRSAARRLSPQNPAGRQRAGRPLAERQRPAIADILPHDAADLGRRSPRRFLGAASCAITRSCIPGRMSRAG